MSILLTGFPGYLGSALLPRLLRRSSGEAVCLVQPKFAAMAGGRVAELEREHPELAGRVRLVEGDITVPGLGIDDEDLAGVREVWHLAAVYDLAVARDLGVRVNVDGTRNVIAVAERCPDLERLQYFSTCYVSGRYAGPFAEDDLEVGAPFNNHYEATKHDAEVLVREAMARGLPATIYRPAIVVGDSRTGETQKYDGPYFIIQWLLRQGRHAIMPFPGDPTMARVNVVPREFVIDAVEHLSGLEQSAGRTYQLADPHPLTVGEMADAIAGAIPTKLVRVPLPRRLAKGAIRHVPGVHRVMRIPPESVDYFAHPTHYLTDHAQADLAGSGIEVPRFADYVGTLIDFMRRHPEVGAAPMV